MNEQESEKKPFVPAHRQRPLGVDKDKQQNQQETKLRNLRLDMAATFSSLEGRRVLRHIFLASGFGESNIGGNAQLGMDVLQGTLYNAARQNLYLELRKFIPHNILKVVEFDNLEELE